jgi:hypothetical protein
MRPVGDSLDNKRAMRADDIDAWIAAGLPALNRRQLSAFARTLAWAEGSDPAEIVALAKTISDSFQLAASPPSPSRVPSNPTSSRPTKSGRTAGNGPKGKLTRLNKKARKFQKRQAKVTMALAAGEPISPADIPLMMATADPELRALWLGQAPRSDVPGAENAERATIMLDADDELRTMWLEQATAAQPAGAPVAINADYAIDAERLALHQQAKTLAQTRCDANPRLDPGETYALAAIEIADRGSSVI